MKRLVLVKVCLIILASEVFISHPAMAQNPSPEQPFMPTIHKPQRLDSKNIAVMLSWPGKNSMLVQANTDLGVYYVVKFCPQGIVSFGYSKEFLSSVADKGVTLHNEGLVNFQKPYIMRESEKGMSIFQESEQSVDKLFYALNQLYRKLILPGYEGRPIDVQGLGNVELGKSIDVEFPANWWWGNTKLPPLIA